MVCKKKIPRHLSGHVLIAWLTRIVLHFFQSANIVVKIIGSSSKTAQDNCRGFSNWPWYWSGSASNIPPMMSYDTFFTQLTSSWHQTHRHYESQKLDNKELCSKSPVWTLCKFRILTQVGPLTTSGFWTSWDTGVPENRWRPLWQLVSHEAGRWQWAARHQRVTIESLGVWGLQKYAFH